jgi:hypothetical protein
MTKGIAIAAGSSANLILPISIAAAVYFVANHAERRRHRVIYNVLDGLERL